MQMNLNENESNSHFQRIRPEQFREKASGGAIRSAYAHWFDRLLAQQCDIEARYASHAKKEKIPENITLYREELQQFFTKVGGISKAERFAMDSLSEDIEKFSVNSSTSPHLQAGTCCGLLQNWRRPTQSRK